MRTGGEGGGRVEEIGRGVDNFLSSHRVVTRSLFGAVLLGDDVRTVERVVEAAPPGVGGIEGVASVVDGDDELRSCDLADFGVDVGRGDLEMIPFGLEVADFYEKAFVGDRVDPAFSVLQIPPVDTGLKVVPLLEERPVSGSEIANDGVESFPDGVGVDARPGSDLIFDHVVEEFVDFQSTDIDVVRHVSFLSQTEETLRVAVPEDFVERVQDGCSVRRRDEGRRKM